MQTFVLVALLALLSITAITVARLRGLFAAAMLMGIYSFLGAGWMFLLDAPDVAFTEAAVGAGVSTVLALGALSLTGQREKKPQRMSPWPLLVVVATGAVLIYGTLDMPHFGDPEAPVHNRLVAEFLDDKVPSPRYDHVEPHIPNIVTVVLASYRGYDTLGETAVIFTAAIAVIALLRELRRRPTDAS